MLKCCMFVWFGAQSQSSKTFNPHLCVWREPSFGLGPGYSTLGGSAALCQAAGCAAAVGERGLGGDLVQRKLEAFILRLPKDTSKHSMWCILSNIVGFLHSYVKDLTRHIITQGEIPVLWKGCLLKNTNSTFVPMLRVWFFSRCKNPLTSV